MFRRIAVLLAMVAILGVGSLAQATVIASHSGLSDPTTEGWTFFATGDTATGGTDSLPYWQLTCASGKYGEYDGPTMGASDFSGNWKLTAVVEPMSLSAYACDTNIVAVVGASDYHLGLRSDGLYDSNFNNKLYDTPITTGQYYTIALQKASSGAGADVWLNGTKVFPNLVMSNNWGFYSAEFGDSDSGGSGAVSRWNSVVFDNNIQTPEPSTLVLAAMGLISLLAYAWRKRR